MEESIEKRLLLGGLNTLPNLRRRVLEVGRRVGTGLLALALLAAGFTGFAQGSIPENRSVWVARYKGPGLEDLAYSLAVSPDGSRVYVTGSSHNSGYSYDYATVAYSASSGAQLWVARYNGPANSADYAYSLAVSPDGSRVYVTGMSYGSNSWSDYATVAYSASSGAQLWAARYNGPANSDDYARSLVVSRDGSHVYVTGSSHDSGTSFDYATVAYSASSGAQLWAARYDGPGSSDDDARSLAVSPDGSLVYVTGSSYGSNGFQDYATVAYSASSGAQLWAARYDGPGKYADGAWSLAVSPDGSRVYVAGVSYGSGTSGDYATVAYSASSGAQLWAARYNGPANSYDAAYSLAVSPDGSRVYVAGVSGLGTSSDWATVAYSASGAQLWAASYNRSNSYDYVYSIAVSPDGSRVYVTGSSSSDDSSDYATVAYSASSGAQLWAARYGSAGSSDEAHSIAVSPDGSRVYVTGESYGSRGRDYATVAYRAPLCANGRDELGPASGVVHSIELGGYVHGVNCDVVAANGL